MRPSNKGKTGAFLVEFLVMVPLFLLIFISLIVLFRTAVTRIALEYRAFNLCRQYAIWYNTSVYKPISDPFNSENTPNPVIEINNGIVSVTLTTSTVPVVHVKRSCRV